MRRIRVVHITPSVRLLGARRSLLTLVQNLSGTRVESLVVVPSRGALTDEFDRLRIPYEVVYLPPWRKAKSWLTMRRQVAALHRVVRDFQTDIIHCNEIYPNPHALVAATQHGRIGAELLSRFAQGRPLSPQGIPVVTHMRLSVNDRLIRNYYLKDATRLIAVSHGAASDFNHCSWKGSRVRVVYNGINFEPFVEAKSQRDAIREKLGFAPGDFVIGQVGLMMPRKRPRFLLDAAPEILKRVPNARFLFIGDASPGQDAYLDSLKQVARDKELESAIRFLPFQTQVAPYFAALDLNMLVSDEEGFGRVILEAAAAGVPTVGSRVGGIPELIQHGNTGYLLGAEGSDGSNDDEFWKELGAFAEIVESLAVNPVLRQTLADAAFNRASELFSEKSYVDNVVGVFEEAIEAFNRKRDMW